MYQVLDGQLIEVTTMGELLLGWQKGGLRHLMEVAVMVKFPIHSYNNYFGAFITDCLIEGGCYQLSPNNISRSSRVKIMRIN